MYRPTNRTYRNTLTKEVYTLYTDDETDNHYLMNNEGNKIKDALISNISGVEYKFADGSIIKMNMGEFITPDTPPVERRYASYVDWIKL